MARIIIEILKSVHLVFLHYSQIFRVFDGINSPTYCHDRKKIKSKLSTIIDYLYLFFVLRVVPTHYHLLQFDTKNRKSFREYMDESSNSPLLRKKLYKSLWDDRYSSLVNDKYVFHCMCRYHALPVPEMYGQYRDGEFHGKEDSLADLILRRNLEKVILKPLRGMRGIGIKMISRDAIFKEGNRLNAEAYEDIANDLRNGHFIVQEVIKQHPELNELTPYSINTIRITTFLEKNGKVEFLAAILRMSSDHSPVDNFKSGGILTGIEMETGKLRKYGLLHPSYGGRLTEHPLTHTKFVDFQIPYWEQIKSTLARAQETFYHLKSIGWDCAVTSDGPVIIEGNIEYGIVATQAEGGGLLTDKNRRLFSQYGLKI